MDSIKNILFYGVLIYAGVVVVMYLFQRKLQYIPDQRRLAPEQAGVANARELTLVTPDGERVVAWYAVARPGKPTIVYFHGNGGALWYRADRMKLALDAGYGMLLAGYRGYGGSTGSPTEAGLMIDGRAAVDYLRNEDVSLDRMVFYGESLGTGVAVRLAAQTPPGAIVLESPFTSAADVGAAVYWWLPVRLLMKDQFRSSEAIGSVRSPLLIVHGTRDRVVPITSGRRLFEGAQEPKRMIEIPDGEHNMVLGGEIWREIIRFIDDSVSPKDDNPGQS